MLALKIQSTKNFMNQLLTGELFDSFLLEEATISGAIDYSLDGHIHPEFYGEEPISYDFLPWTEAKSVCYQLIKGKRTPLYFKFVLQLKPEAMNKLLEQNSLLEASENLKAMVLSIRFDERGTILTTGTSYHNFSLDKSPDKLWDQALLRFLNGKEVDYEELT